MCQIISSVLGAFPRVEEPLEVVKSRKSEKGEGFGMASYVYMYVCMYVCVVCVRALARVCVLGPSRACGISEFEGGTRFWSLLEWRVMCVHVCGGVLSAVLF